MIEVVTNKLLTIHNEACEIVYPIARALGVEEPLDIKVSFFCKAGRSAGFYRHWSKDVHYDLAYAIAFPDQFRDTAIHEVCHAYQYRLMARTKSHGELWKALMKAAVGHSNQYHTMNRKVAQAVALGLVLEVACDRKPTQQER